MKDQVENNSSKCLIIVGMHRSGTSFTASLLQKAGLNIGSDLLGTGVGNELGHFENEDFLTFHKNVLLTKNQNPDGWSQNKIEHLNDQEQTDLLKIIQSNTTSQWGWKEPRTTLFLDIYKKIIPNAYYLFVYRNPWEVVDSLFRRSTDNELLKSPLSTINNWEFYNKIVLDFYKNNIENSLLVDIETVMQKCNTVIELINSKFNFELIEIADTLFEKEKFKNESTSIQQFYCEYAFPTSIDLYKLLQTHSSISPFKLYSPSNLNKESLIQWWRASSYLNKSNIDQPSEDIITKIITDIIEPLNNVNERLTKENTYLKEDLNWITNSKWWKIRSF